MDPSTFIRAVAAANSSFKDSLCLGPLGGASAVLGTVALYSTVNNGATWNYACAPWPNGSPTFCAQPCNNFSFNMGDPSVAWDTQGNAYAAYLIVANCAACTGRAVAVAKYSPATDSWSPFGFATVSFADTARSIDRPYLVIDTSVDSPFRDRLYVTWSNYTPPSGFDQANIMIAYADANAGIWQTRSLDTTSNKNNHAHVATGKDGTVYAVWQRWTADNPEATMFRKSIDGGNSWGPAATQITTHFANMGKCIVPSQQMRGLTPTGALGIDHTAAHFNRLYYVTNDVAQAGNTCATIPCAASSGNSVNVYLIYSDDGGSSWSGRVLVNDDSQAVTNHHYFPWLAVDQTDGSVNVGWYDTRNSTPLGFNKNITQMFYARSVSAAGVPSFEPNVLMMDNGQNFEHHVPLSGLGCNVVVPGRQEQYGDYGALAAANRVVWQVSTDTRQIYPPPDTNPKKEDIAVRTITNCSAPAWDALAPTLSCDRLSWNPVNFVGTNAGGVTYYVYRSMSAACPASHAGQTLLTPSGVTGTTFVDTSGNQGTTYYYQVDARNDCPGAFTPMTVSTACSPGVVYRAPISAAITVPAAAVCSLSTGNKASASLAPSGSTYLWTITNGQITGGSGSSQVVTYTAGTSQQVGLSVNVTFDTYCNDLKSVNVPIYQPLVSNSISLAGSASVCTGGSAGTATVTEPPGQGVGITHKWGFRTTPTGSITDISGRTGTAYLLTASDFPGPGTYYLVCKSNTQQCGTEKTSGNIQISVSAFAAPTTPVITPPALPITGGTSGLKASVPTVTGASYSWVVTNGSITAGQNTREITFTAGPAGSTMTIQVVEIVGSCSTTPATVVLQVDFVDVPSSHPQHDFVNLVAKNGITAGCGGGNYCPSANVTRAQMAVFLERAKQPPGFQLPACSPTFNDVVCPSQYADWISQLVADGVTSGCGSGIYCPAYSVDRRTMAVFLLKARYGAAYTPPACTGVFADVPCSSNYAGWIEDLKTRQITAGCGGGPPPAPLFYCPYAPVTRGSMAVFITKTWNLQ